MATLGKLVTAFFGLIFFAGGLLTFVGAETVFQEIEGVLLIIGALMFFSLISLADICA